MINAFEKFKGIHPGAIVARELKKRKLAQRPFALSILEHPQVLNAITREKRGMNISLALKIEKALGLDEGTLMILQTYYDIKLEKQKHNSMPKPELSKIRSVVFWDTAIENIDWEKHYKYVIRRIFERGEQKEKQEIIRFYGKQKIEEVIGQPAVATSSLPVMQHLNSK